MKIIKPKISVIMPYFRKKNFFKKSIYSVLSQTFKSYEVIIIFDDNNLDELNDICFNYFGLEYSNEERIISFLKNILFIDIISIFYKISI